MNYISSTRRVEVGDQWLKSNPATATVYKEYLDRVLVTEFFLLDWQLK